MPLSFAAQSSHLKAVKSRFLIKETGVDDDYGLYFVVESSLLDIAKFLLEEAKADVELKDQDGKTELDMMPQEGAEDRVCSDQFRAVAA